MQGPMGDDAARSLCALLTPEERAHLWSWTTLRLPPSGVWVGVVSDSDHTRTAVYTFFFVRVLTVE